MSDRIWIGLVNVVPSDKANMNFDGAFVNALCFAKDPEDFNYKVSQALEKELLTLVDIEDIEPFEERGDEYVVDEALLKLAENVQSTGAVCFGTFHAYDTKGEN